MVNVTNNTSRNLDFVVAGRAKDGSAKTEAVRPFETKDIDLLDRNSPQVRGHELAGVITVGDRQVKPQQAGPKIQE